MKKNKYFDTDSLNEYFDIDSLNEKAEKKHIFVIKQKINALYGICNSEPCDVELKIHRTMTASQLINILSDLADIAPNCELSINIKK